MGSISRFQCFRCLVMNNIIRKKKSFTLVEVMVSVALLAVLMTYVIVLFTQGNKSGAVASESVAMQTTARNVMARMIRDIRVSNVTLTDTVLENDDETLSIGDVDYMLDLDPNPSVFSREGVNLGLGVERVEVAIVGDIVDIGVTVHSSNPMAPQSNITLYSSVRRRN